MKPSKEKICLEEWPEVFVDNLEIDKQELFLRRKNAIEALIRGEKTICEITNLYNIEKTELYRFLERCLSIDTNGNILGYRALIPYFRLKPYNRIENIDGYWQESNSVNKSGSFKKFLTTYPDLKLLIDNLVFPKRKNIPQSTIYRTKDIHEKLIKACKSQGISPEKGDYPFNSKDLGLRSLYRYVKNLKVNNPDLSVRDYGDDAKVKHNNTGIGDSINVIERPFERVEFDGHKIDAIFAIKYTTLEGDEVVDIMNRIWILAIIDCATKVILGYKICLGREYSAVDILECYKNAILPHKSPNFTIPGLTLPDNGGYHSIAIPTTEFAIWDEIAMDNAKSNRSKIVKEKNLKVIGARANYGPVGTPTRRPIIEKFFDALEKNGFQRLTNTTGSKLEDPRRQNPESKAIQYKITPDEIEQIVEVLIANRNNSPLRSLGSLTPLEAMQQRINRNMPFRVLDEEFRDGEEFTSMIDHRTIRGALNTGRRPYIEYEGIEYRNDVLAEAYDLINTKLTLVVNIEDLRIIKAFLPNGCELGYLKAKGKWGIRKHSIKLRKVINKLYREGKILLRNQDDPIEIYHEYLKSKAKHNKQARNEIAKIQKESNKQPNELVEKHEKPVHSYKNNKEMINIKTFNSNRNLPNSKHKIERFSFNS